MGMPLVHVRHCSKAEFSHWKTHRTQNNPYSEVLGSLTASADRMGTTEQQEQKQQKPTTEKVTQLSSLRIRTKFHSPTHSHSVHAAHTIQVPRVLQLHVSMHRDRAQSSPQNRDWEASCVTARKHKCFHSTLYLLSLCCAS